MQRDKKYKGLDDGSIVRIPEKTNTSSDAVCQKTQESNVNMEQDIKKNEGYEQKGDDRMMNGGIRIKDRVREDYSRTFEPIESQNNFDLSRSTPKDSRSQDNNNKYNEYAYKSALLITNQTPPSSSNSMLNNPASSKLIYQQNYQQQEQSNKEKRSQYCQLMEKYLLVPCQNGFNGHYYADTLRKQGQNISDKGQTGIFIKRIENELKSLKSKLLEWLDDEDTPSAFIFYDINNIQLIQLFIIGSRRSSFSYGIFCFDVLIPTDYPKYPPRIHLNCQLSQSNLKIAPYIEFDGRVCLDILGTQKGRESEDSNRKWQQNNSNLESVIEIIGQLIFSDDVMRNARLELGDVNNSEILWNNNNNTSECNSNISIPGNDHDQVYARAYNNAVKYVTLQNSMEFILNLVVNQQIKELEIYNFIKDHFVYNEQNIKQMVIQWIEQEEDNNIQQQPLYAGIVEQNYQEIAILLQQKGFPKLAKEKIKQILILIGKIKE